MKHLFTYILITSFILLTGCSKHEQESPRTDDMTGKEMIFSAYNNRAITRNGNDWSWFDDETKYYLYAIRHETPISALDWTENNATLYNTEGIEANGVINYGAAVMFPSYPLNYYGVTYGTPGIEIPDPVLVSGVPTYPIEVNPVDDKLNDLMYASAIAPQATSGNVITLDFLHSLSKIRFELVKKTGGEADEKFDGVYIQSVTLDNMYSEGALNLATGQYSLPDAPTRTRTFYDRAANEPFGGKQFIETSQKGIKIDADSETDVEMLIFPRSIPDDFNQNTYPYPIINIMVGKGDQTDWGEYTCELKYEEIDSDGNTTGNFKPFEFKANYEYVISLMVTDNSARLLIFETQVYDWINVNYDEDAQDFLGRPISFGDILWMDRNLGATSADPINDWEGCRGFFYQFGRSVPYMIDPDKIQNTNTNLDCYNNLYTYDQNGNRVYGSVLLDVSRAEDTFAWFPGDIPKAEYSKDKTGYMYVKVKISWPTVRGNAYWVAGNYNIGNPASYDPGIMDGVGESENAAKYWQDIDNQPCPAGWRLPTKENVAVFMPDPAFGSDPPRWFEDNRTDLDIKCKVLAGAIEDRVYGIGVNPGTIAGIYILKNKGTSRAFHVRIQLIEGKSSGKGYNENYYEISRIPGTQTDTYAGLTMNTIEEKYDWDHPSEVMKIAATGSLSELTGLTHQGLTCHLRTSESSMRGGSYTFYLHKKVGQVGIGIQDGNGKSQGANIRCVRDL